ncbi:MAG: ribosome-associated translation inhibitor RaiA [Patescibacteria group bacterium]|jgi:ribosomal subunit interface protein
MKIDYKFRNSTIDGFLTEYADKKFTHVMRLAPEASSLEVEFNDARGSKGNDAEVNLVLTFPGQRESVYVSVTAENFQAAIDQAKDKLDTQLRKIKEKMIDKSKESIELK